MQRNAGSSRAHRDLKNEIRYALGQLGFVVLWNNESGTATIDGRYIRFGVGHGGSDLLGVVTHSATGLGVLLALEVKTGNAQLDKHQKRFLELVNRMGGEGHVVRSVEDAVLIVTRARHRKLRVGGDGRLLDVLR